MAASREHGWDEADLERLGDFARAARASVPAQPPPAARIVPLLAEVAREAAYADSPPRRRRSSLRMPVRALLLAGLLVGSTAGLAIAGVGIPDPIRSALETAGVDLPDDEGGATRGEQTRDTTPAQDGQAGAAEAIERARGGENGGDRGARRRGEHARGRSGSSSPAPVRAQGNPPPPAPDQAGRPSGVQGPPATPGEIGRKRSSEARRNHRRKRRRRRGAARSSAVRLPAAQSSNSA